MRLNLILLIVIGNTLIVNSQTITKDTLKGIWINEASDIYTLYDSTYCHYISVYPDEIIYERLIYGFYSNCNPQHVSDLSDEGTGEYFFIIDDYEYDSSGKLKQNLLDCWSIVIDNERNREEYVPDSLYLHFGRKGIVEYKKVYKLPETLIKYLKKQQPEVYFLYLELIEMKNNILESWD